jgi:PIN domain nuclease of toxin-antitoxin system
VGSGSLKLLIDTHILIWLAEGTADLVSGSVARLEDVTRADGLAVSALSFWEVAMLQERQRITLSLPVRRWREIVLETSGFIETPLTGEIAIESVNLPSRFHNDPADRMLVATARLNGWTLATQDDRILSYGNAGNVDVLHL